MSTKRTKTKTKVVKKKTIEKTTKKVESNKTDKIKKELKEEMLREKLKAELKVEMEKEHKEKVEKADKEKAKKILDGSKTKVETLERPDEDGIPVPPKFVTPDEIPRAINETDNEESPDGYKRKSPTTPQKKIYTHKEYEKLIKLYAKQHPVQYKRKRSELAKKLAALK